jgi:hypothetical protein
MEYIYIDTDKQGEKSLYKKQNIYKSSIHKDDWNEIKDLPRAERNRRLFTIEEVDVIKILIVKNTDKVRVYLGLKEPILMKEEQPVAHINLCADCEDDECDGTECFLPEGYVRSMVFGVRSQPRIVLPFIPMQPNA